MNEGPQKFFLLISFVVSFLLPYQDLQAHPYKGPNLSPSSKEIQSLNACIEYLNETVYVTRWLQQGLVAYNMHANYYHGVNMGSAEQQGNLSITIDQFEAPTAIYEQTRKQLGDLNPKDRDLLRKGIGQIEQLIDEMTYVYDSLKLYVDTQSYREDNMVQSQHFLQRFERLFFVFDRQLTDTYEYVFFVYAQLEKKRNPSLHDKSYGHLFSMMEASQSLLGEVKRNFYQPDEDGFYKISLLADSLEQLVSTIPALTYRSKPSAEEKRLLNKIVSSTQSLIDKTSTLSVELIDDQFTFERFIYHFNQSSVYLNMLIGLWNEDKLYYPQHPFLFKFVQPSAIAPPLPDPSNLPLAVDSLSLEKFAPSHLVFLLDISKSMNEPQKLPLLKQSLTKLIPVLRSVDTVTLITFSGKAQVILPPTSLRRPEQVLASLDSLQPSGSTQLRSGLNMAYKMANEHYITGGNNRIILATDGLFSVDSKVLKMVRDFSNKEIFLTVFNFGDNANATSKLEKLAGKGKGNFTAISNENADRTLLKELMSKEK